MIEQAAVQFGTDGIRGVAGLYPLDPATVLRIGRAIGRWVRSHAETPQVVMGRDTRISGHLIASALIAGLLAELLNILDAGVISTPGVATVTRHHSAALGIVISASHNPFEQNGIKLFGSDGFKLNDADEEEIEALIASLDLAAPAVDLGALTDGVQDAQRVYLETALAGFSLDGLSVALDCSNGAGASTAPEAFRRAGAIVHVMKASPNGLNINLNCGSEYVRRDRSALLSAIHGNNADLGIALDGDADRVVFVTPDGMLIDGDHVLGILAAQMMASGELAGGALVATDMSNSGLEHFLKGRGIRLERTKVGDRYVMERMRAGGFVLGGEQAGHLIILDAAHTVGDGIYAGLLVAALAAQNKREGGLSLSELARQIPRYPQVIASAHLTRQVDLKNVAHLSLLIEQTLAAFDGKGRVNVRFSGTEPNLLRAMLEGGPANKLKDVVQRALTICRCVADAAHSPNPPIDVVDCVTGAPIDLGST